MKFHQRQLYTSFTLLYLVFLTFTTGHEGHNSTSQQSFGSNDTQSAQEEASKGNSSSSDYDSGLPVHNDNDEGDALSTTSEGASPINVEIRDVKTGGETEIKNETAQSTEVENVKDNKTDISSATTPGTSTTFKIADPANDTVSEKITKPSEHGDSVSSTPPEIGESSLSSETSNTSSTKQPQPIDQSMATNSDELEETLSTETLSSTEGISPVSIVAEDLEDISDYTSTPLSNEKIDPPGLRTWAVVVTSVLISFAIIFTILYIIRGALIRRRKADQRRLLRGSISSEGYFYGDEANTGGKFEL